ncbi:MAG: HisA/HisF-related TIM barrel protein, partial [Kiritimatiellia bacterium]
MEIYPAIDLKDGRCVRLRQGLADQVTVYGEDPVAMAQHWAEQGARWLHVVDLDGAFRGVPAHTGVIARITAAIRIPVQVGGGLRTEDQMQAVLDAGAARFVVGTRACADPGGLARLAARFGERLVVGIDARDGRVRVSGWVEATEWTSEALARRAAEAGVKTVIYTDT